MKKRTCLRAQAAKQPHGHQSSSAVPSNCKRHGSKLQDFFSERLIGVEKAGTVQLIDWLAFGFEP